MCLRLTITLDLKRFLRYKSFQMLPRNATKLRIRQIIANNQQCSGLSSLGVPGVSWYPQILADKLTLSQPRGADYAHQIILAPPDFQTFRRPWCCREAPKIWGPLCSIFFSISVKSGGAWL